MTDLHNDIMAVNHNGGADELGRGTNCLYCTTAYEMRRRGYDVQAQQDWVGGIVGYMPTAMFEGAKEEPVFDISNIPYNSSKRMDASMIATQQLMDAVEAQGEGARGYVSVQWAGGAGGHSMAYEVINGEMHLIDCQTGEDFTGEDIWGERMYAVDNCSITRVDNCKIANQDMVDRYIEDSGTEDSANVLDEALDQLIEKLKKRKKKKKKPGNGSVTKQVNQYRSRINLILKNTSRTASNQSSRARRFVSSRLGVK